MAFNVCEHIVIQSNFGQETKYILIMIIGCENIPCFFLSNFVHSIMYRTNLRLYFRSLFLKILDKFIFFFNLAKSQLK